MRVTRRGSLRRGPSLGPVRREAEIEDGRESGRKAGARRAGGSRGLEALKSQGLGRPGLQGLLLRL